MTEREITEGILNTINRNSSFEKAVDAYSERLYWHIRKMVNNHQDSDDLLQNTYVRAYNKIDTFRGDCTFLTWLYRIATNEALNFMKSKAYIRQKETTTLKTEMDWIYVESEGVMDSNKIENALNNAISILPPKQKLVFNMRYFDEMSYKQMADILETSESALKSSYHFAVKKIEDWVNNNYEL